MDPKQLPAFLYFSSARPPVLELPHLITVLDAELIGKVVHLTKSKPGLWPVPAPFDEQDVYDVARESAPFSAWALPANHGEVLAFSPMIQEAIFGAKLMMVDATFDEATLARLAVTTGQRMETGAYVTQGYQDLSALPQLISQCGWALIPIGPERSKGLFVVSSEKADWIAKMHEWCDREGRNFGEIKLEGGSLTIVDRPASDKYRDNAIAHHIDGFLGDMEVYFGGVDESILPMIERRMQVRRKLREDVARAEQGNRPV
jgi:hypothetical protein